jgi:hypothetical protein
MQRNRPWAVGTFLVLSALCAADTRAQNPPTSLEPYRNRPNFTPADEAVITAWINTQIQDWKDAGNKAAADAAFLQAFMAELSAPGVDAFRVKLVDLFAAVCAQEFALGKQGDVALARVLAKTLAELDRVGTRPALEKGLSHPDPEVRYHCARAFVILIDNIVFDQRLIQQTTQILQEAGQKETNPVVLTRIYLALSYPEEKDAQHALEPLLNILSARLDRLRQGALVAEASDAVALEYLLKHAVRLPAPLRVTLVGKLATMLRLDVQRYADARPGAPGQDDLEYRIYLEERLLSEIVKPNPNEPSITKAMQDGGPNARKEMLARLKAWIGTPEKPGLLNAPPWNVPIGAP